MLKNQNAHIDIFNVFLLRIVSLIFLIAFNSVDFSNEIIFACDVWHCDKNYRESREKYRYFKVSHILY